MDTRLIIALVLLAACNRPTPEASATSNREVIDSGNAAFETSATLAAQLPDHVVVSVNEPFLSAEVAEGHIVLRSPDDPEGSTFDIAATSTARTADKARRSWGGTGKAGDIRIEVSNQPCTDSMSGATFPYSGSIELNGKRHEGCARAAGTPAPGEGQ